MKKIKFDLDESERKQDAKEVDEEFLSGKEQRRISRQGRSRQKQRRKRRGY